jgi:hypothetical protein
MSFVRKSFAPRAGVGTEITPDKVLDNYYGFNRLLELKQGAMGDSLWNAGDSDVRSGKKYGKTGGATGTGTLVLQNYENNGTERFCENNGVWANYGLTSPTIVENDTSGSPVVGSYCLKVTTSQAESAQGVRATLPSSINISSYLTQWGFMALAVKCSGGTCWMDQIKLDDSTSTVIAGFVSSHFHQAMSTSWRWLIVNLDLLRAGLTGNPTDLKYVRLIFSTDAARTLYFDGLRFFTQAT